MIFGYFIFFTATLLSFVAAYYSVTGLTAIFAAAVIPVIIMGGILELGKVVATVWLHTNWYRVPKMFKFYLVPAVAFLMLLTSMGIFGFLSKAHLDQAVPSGDVAAQVQIYDDKIKTQRDNIDAARRALRQLDESVDQLMSRSNDERGAEKAVTLRRNQAKERQRLQNEIAQAQKEITKLQEERAPIASQLRKVEAEVGPIKYLAALVYGETADQSTLESAVRWIIILIVLVFDPLALVLILAGTKQISWARLERAPPKEIITVAPTQPKKYNNSSVDLDKANIEIASLEKNFDLDALYDDVRVAQEEERAHKELIGKITILENQLAALNEKQEGYIKDIEQLNKELLSKTKNLDEASAAAVLASNTYTQTIAELNEEVSGNKKLQDDYASLEKDYVELYNLKLGLDVELAQKIEIITKLEQDIADLEQLIASLSEQSGNQNRLVEQNDLVKDAIATNINIVPVDGSAAPSSTEDAPPPNAAFGTKFPNSPSKGDLFLRVDCLPSRLYKWNDSKWIEIDKAITDSYTYDEAYIKFLITKLAGGDYDTDDLSESEQEQVTEYLKRTRRV